jgi:hypothetical protein
MIFLLIIALVLFQMPFFNTLSVGDLALIIFNMFYIIKFKKFPKIVFKNEKLLFVYILWFILSLFLIDDYDSSLYFNRLLRLMNVIIAYFFIQSYFHLRPIKIKKLIRYVLILNYLILGLLVIEFISMYIGDRIDFRVSYRDMELNTNRIRSVFTEPSILSIFLVYISIFIIKYAKESNNLKFYRPIIIINISAILFTLSFVGLVGLIIVVFFLFDKAYKFVPIVLALFLVLFQTNLEIADRFDIIIDSEDNSANQRILGSWIASYSLSNNMYFGNGLGHESQIKDIRTRVDYFSKFNSKLNNSFAVIYYENGLIGLILVLSFILSNFYSNKYFVFFATFFCFSHGAYFYTLFWVGLALLKINYSFNEKKLYDKHIKSTAVLQ